MDTTFSDPYKVLENSFEHNCFTANILGKLTRFTYRDVKLSKEEDDVVTHKIAYAKQYIEDYIYFLLEINR